jgi:predicted RNase H-like HicB family nuclease
MAIRFIKYKLPEIIVSETFVGSIIMLNNYTAKYTRIDSGYMGKLVEWPEVITEGKTLDKCREMLKDALSEMVLAYQQQEKDIPLGGGLLEQLSVEI